MSAFTDEQGAEVSETTASITWLTQDAFDRLNAELQNLIGPGREEITRRIEQAREEGDLRENGGYHAAKEEQGKQEARIRQLKQLLEHAKVGEAPPDDGVVEPGMVVTVRFEGDDDTMTFLLGSREDAGAALDVYSAKSPLGGAINGRRVGDTAKYTLPNGGAMSVTVLEAKPYTG